MPKEISCIVEDFKEYLAAETRCFDAIAIDVGGPGFCYEEQFDPATCHSITARLNPGGRAILNMLVATNAPSPSILNARSRFPSVPVTSKSCELVIANPFGCAMLSATDRILTSGVARRTRAVGSGGIRVERRHIGVSIASDGQIP
jgi:spermidine synthase